MINTFLSLGDFFERYQTLAILMCLGCLLLIAGYIKKNFPKWFDNGEELKSQEELDKEEFESMIQTQKVEEVVEEDEDDEEETYFINNSNRDAIAKKKNKK